MKIKDGRITILTSGEDVVIEIRDSDANIKFCHVVLTTKQFCQAMGRLSHTECHSMEVFGLERVGKNMEHKKLEFQMPDSINDTGYTRDEIASMRARDNCPHGWVPDLYFNSQDSYFKEMGKEMARCTIRRWVQ